jgi:hypothetical protein
MIKRTISALLAATCLFSLTVFAQDEPPARPARPSPEQIAAREQKNAAEWNKNPAPTDPRDFSGVWWTRGYDRTCRPVTDTPMSP